MFKTLWFDEFTHNRDIYVLKRFPPKYVPTSVRVTTRSYTQHAENSDNATERWIRSCISCIDLVNAELNRRFRDNSSVLEGLSAFQPTSHSYFNHSVTLPFAAHYGLNEENLKCEMRVAHNMVKALPQESMPKTTSELLRLLNRNREAFPILIRATKLALCIPASTACCERTFSAMRRIKTHLRTRMSTERLSNLSVLSVERARSKRLDMTKVVDRFAEAHQNARIALA